MNELKNMQELITLIAKGLRLLFTTVRLFINKYHTWWKFYSNNIQLKNFRSNGVPFVMVARGGKCKIGNNFRINNGNLGTPIGRPQKCILFVNYNASIIIGNNVGISSTAIIAFQSITIGDNVQIGGGTCIYDTDFHSLNSHFREDTTLDLQNTNTQSVIIMENAFIGAHSTILKGVTIGKNSIVGACSVVTKSIPDNEIWAGNPARLLKNL